MSGRPGSVRLGINGVGSIGRAAFRQVFTDPLPGIQIVAVNDLRSAEDIAYGLRRDSVRGDFPLARVRHQGRDGLRIGEDLSVRTFCCDQPGDIPWGLAGVDVVLEATGAHRDYKAAAAHLDADGGARKVIVSASMNKPDAVLVMGANENTYDPFTQHVISPASCGVNALAVASAALLTRWQLSHMSTTVHLAKQGWQRSQDGLDGARHDPRLGRAESESIIPHRHVDASLLRHVLPALPKMPCSYYCVPTQIGSWWQLTAQLDRRPSAAQVNHHMITMAKGPFGGLLAVDDDRSVSIDVRGHPESCLLDLSGTQVTDDGYLMISGWFDGVWGFTARLLDLVRLVMEGVY